MENEKKYILTNLVSAVPMTKSEFRSYMKGTNGSGANISSIVKDLFTSEKTLDIEGYMVTMSGNLYWFPKNVFESMTIEVIDNKKLPSGVNIDEEMVDKFIHSHDTMTLGNKTTVVRATLQNGYEVIESSGCVDAENYDISVGEAACMKRVKTKVWDYLGFLLQTAWKSKQ